MGDRGWRDERTRVGDPVVAVDADLRIRGHNDPATELFDDDPLGRDLGEALGAELAETLRDALPGEGSGDGDDVVVETHLEPGDESWYEVRAYPDGSTDAPAAETGYSLLFHEVTDRRQRRAELERRETMLWNLPDPVYEIDADGRVVYVNEAFADLQGFPRDVYEREVPEIGTGMRPEDLDRAQELIRELLSDDPETGDWGSFEMIMFTRTGERIPCENHMAVLIEDGEFRSTFGTVNEITDRRRRRERLRVLERVLEHNLRTEAAKVEGHLESVGDRVDDPAVDEELAGIRAATENLLAIGHKTRRVGRAIVSGEELSTASPSGVVGDAVEDVADRYPDSTIAVDLEALPAIRSGPALRMAIEELVENAVEHSDRPEPTVEITGRTADVAVEEVEYHQQRVVIEIADDGPGIPDHERRVVTGERTESPLEHSDGLGLWTAAWIVEEYGGTIEIRDREPRGTVVDVYLPRA